MATGMAETRYMKKISRIFMKGRGNGSNLKDDKRLRNKDKSKEIASSQTR
jgi:hypothetical protein